MEPVSGSGKEVWAMKHKMTTLSALAALLLLTTGCGRNDTTTDNSRHEDGVVEDAKDLVSDVAKGGKEIVSDVAQGGRDIVSDMTGKDAADGTDDGDYHAGDNGRVDDSGTR